MKNDEIKVKIYGGTSYGTSMSSDKYKARDKKSHMNIKQIRKLTGLSQKAFSEKYEIPFNTLRSWEAASESSKHRNCPEYIVKLLEFKVLYDLNLNISESGDMHEGYE